MAMLLEMVVKDAKENLDGGMTVSGIVIDQHRKGMHVHLRFSQEEWDRLMAILILKGMMKVEVGDGS